MSNRTANIVIAVVTTAWIANMGAGMAGYPSSESVNGIFMTIVGGAFIARTAGKHKNGNGNGDSE